MEEKYQKILHLPHPDPQTRPRMSLQRRAAQFAPFAALTDYDGLIRETARQTQAEIELDETERERINRCLRLLLRHIAERPRARVRFFCPDSKKPGGSYRSLVAPVARVDAERRLLVLETGERIPFARIVALEAENCHLHAENE